MRTWISKRRNNTQRNAANIFNQGGSSEPPFFTETMEQLFLVIQFCLFPEKDAVERFLLVKHDLSRPEAAAPIQIDRESLEKILKEESSRYKIAAEKGLPCISNYLLPSDEASNSWNGPFFISTNENGDPWGFKISIIPSYREACGLFEETCFGEALLRGETIVQSGEPPELKELEFFWTVCKLASHLQKTRKKFSRSDDKIHIGKFGYEKLCQEITMPNILVEVKQKFRLISESTLRNYIAQYCSEKGIELPKGSGGRPRKKPSPK